MSNKTIPSASMVHGMNPQHLIEKIVRERVYESLYWKEHCFGLTAETLVEKAVCLEYVGGTVGNIRPSPFLCLVVRLLQLQPSEDIIIEFMDNMDFKYLRLLGAFYYRLTAPSIRVYMKLEPLYADYRKIRKRIDSGFEITHVDQIIDDLLCNDRVFDIILPRLTKRETLEMQGRIAKRQSILEYHLDEE